MVFEKYNIYSVSGYITRGLVCKIIKYEDNNRGNSEERRRRVGCLWEGDSERIILRYIVIIFLWPT